MQNSYFRSPWNASHQARHGHFPKPNPNPSPSPKPAKVISIPVHFVESASEAKNKADAAVEIQSRLRGFLVRRKVGILKKIDREVDEIESRINRDRDLIARDAKERVRVSEMLMAVLLRLDSVRGVREYRRKVIRRAILLQERVDSLAEEKIPEIGVEEVVKSESLEKEEIKAEGVETVSEEGDVQMKNEETLEFTEAEAKEETNVKPLVDDVLMKSEETLEIPESLEKEGAKEEVVVTGSEEVMKSESSEDVQMKNEEILEFTEAEAQEETNAKSLEEKTGSLEEEIPVKEIGIDEKALPMEVEEDGWSFVDVPKSEEPVAEFEKVKSDVLATEQKNSSNEEIIGLKSVMERMVEENAAMKGLVTELCERSALQCRLMGGLARRVEQLEKTVSAIERRRKKKREANGESVSENSKCCNKKNGQQLD